MFPRNDLSLERLAADSPCADAIVFARCVPIGPICGSGPLFMHPWGLCLALIVTLPLLGGLTFSGSGRFPIIGFERTHTHRRDVGSD